MERINNPRSGLTIQYSSLHAIFDSVPEALRLAFQQVEQTFAVALLYGTRKFGNFSHEVLLIDATNPNREQINRFFFYIWQNYGIDCARYAWNPNSASISRLHSRFSQPSEPLVRMKDRQLTISL